MEAVEPEVTLSVFALPRLIRNIARTGLKDVHVVDLCNSHFTHMVRSLTDEDPACPVLRRIVAERAAVHEELEKATGLDRDGVKKLLLSIGYGGQVKKFCPVHPEPEMLHTLSGEIRRLARARFVVARGTPSSSGKLPPQKLSLLSLLTLRSKKHGGFE